MKKLLDAVILTNEAWKQVSMKAIVNCWKKRRQKPKMNEEEEMAAAADDDEVVRVPSVISPEVWYEWLNIDNDAAPHPHVSKDQIVQGIKDNSTEAGRHADNDEEGSLSLERELSL